MTDNEAVSAMVARVVHEWGRVDVLVANAGGGRGRPVDTKASNLDPALLQLVVAMNLFGTVYTVNAAAPIMKEQRSGKIITVSSIAGTGPPVDGGYAHYGAAKAAIAHFTRYLAQDLGPYGITANCIAPGVIATGRIMATVIPGSVQGNRDRAELVALRRLGTVEDCAKVVEFLATDLSDCDRCGDIRLMVGWLGDSRSSAVQSIEKGRPGFAFEGTLWSEQPIRISSRLLRIAQNLREKSPTPQID